MKPFIGESRDDDVKRTAEEIRLQFLHDHAGAGASQFYQMLWRVLVNPNLSDSAKVIYALSLPERKNFEWSNDRMGKLVGKSASAVQRAFAELETYGCIASTYRGREKTAHRDFPVPAIVAIAKEIEKKLRRKPAQRAAQGQSLENPEQSKTTVQGQSFENPGRAYLQPRTSKNAAQPQRALPQFRENQPVSRHSASIRGAEVAQPEVGYRKRERISEVVSW